MDYEKLADELHQKMYEFKRMQSKMKMNESIQGEMFVLYIIASSDGDLIPGEISNMMGISSARIAKVLNNLESKGLIIRQIDKNDRRKILIHLTPNGKEFVEKKQVEVRAEMAQMLEKLGGKDAREFIRIIDKLTTIKHNMV